MCSYIGDAPFNIISLWNFYRSGPQTIILLAWLLNFVFIIYNNGFKNHQANFIRQKAIKRLFKNTVSFYFSFSGDQGSCLSKKINSILLTCTFK